MNRTPWRQTQNHRCRGPHGVTLPPIQGGSAHYYHNLIYFGGLSVLACLTYFSYWPSNHVGFTWIHKDFKDLSSSLMVLFISPYCTLSFLINPWKKPYCTLSFSSGFHGVFCASIEDPSIQHRISVRWRALRLHQQAWRACLTRGLGGCGNSRSMIHDPNIQINK